METAIGILKGCSLATGLCPELGAQILGVEGSARMVANAEEALAGARRVLQEAKVDYNAKWNEILRKRITESGLVWCAIGDHFVPEGDHRLLYLHGQQWTGSEYTQGLEKFRRLVQACPECYEYARDRSDSSKKDSAYTHAQRVERDRDGGFVVISDGNKLDLSVVDFQNFPKYISDEELRDRWNMPPKF